MEFFGAFVSGILSVVVYIVVFMGVYKLYYIAKDIHEIKELMERKLRNSADVPAPGRAVDVRNDNGIKQDFERGGSR